MLDVAPTELLLVALVALLVIGPKDLPKAMRFVGKWVGKARGVARQFRAGIDTMMRESELAELEKQWAAENERIMREHSPMALSAPQPNSPPAPIQPTLPDVDDTPPVMVEQPAILPAPEAGASEPVTPKARKPRAPRAKAAS